MPFYQYSLFQSCYAIGTTGFCWILFIMNLIVSSQRVVVDAEKFEFAAIGDTPYSETGRALFVDMINEMNRNPLDFVVHIGDLKSDGSECTNALFEDRKTLFETSAHPFVYVPGDNDWTDCHKPDAGSYNPIERLNTIRTMFFNTSQSLGRQRIDLVRQSDVTTVSNFTAFQENVLWIQAGIVFVTLNIPGSNNGKGQGVPSLEEEFPIRNAANLDWLNGAFDYAEDTNAPAVAVFLQANAIQYFVPTPNQIPNQRHLDDFPLCVPLQGTTTGYDDFLLTLRARASQFQKPVLLVHGDTHTNRIDKPYTGQVGRLFGLPKQEGGLGDGFSTIPNVTRLETFGNPVVGWTRVFVNTERPMVFSFEEGGAFHP